MILVVGDHWTEDDEIAGQPFSGSAGKMVRSALRHQGVHERDVFFTCVFNRRIGDMKSVCVSKAEGIPNLPPIMPKKYCPVKFAPELERLHKEIENVQPTCILALGGVAAWALLGVPGIKKIRGTPAYYTRGDRRHKVIPTYHPNAIFREYSLRPIFLADVEKFVRETAYPEIRRPSRSIWIEPSYDDLLRFEAEHISHADYLSVDIETSGTMITCIGFAVSESLGLVVPFTSAEQADGSYWRSHGEEVRVWQWCMKQCARPIRKVGQNFLYDMHHLWRNYATPMLGGNDDTMLLHHALQPEMEKGLGFLGSIYTDEASWKFMRHKETIKRED